MKTVSKTLIAGALTAALVLPATGALAASKTERAILGAVLGGVAGAALGKGDGGAVALGAVAGAALGAATGQDNRSRRYGDGYRQTGAYYGDSRQRDYRQVRSGYGYGYDARPAYGYDSRYQGRDSRYDHNRRDGRYDAGYGYR